MTDSSQGESLQISGDPGLGEQQAQEIHNTWATYDQVAGLLEAMGFPSMQVPPGARPVLTEDDYVHIEGDAYARTSFRVQRWLEYVRVRHAEMQGRLLCVQNEMSEMMAEHLKALREYYRQSGVKKPAESELKESVKLLPQYKLLKLSEQNLQTALDRIKVERDTFEAYGQGLSRQLTMRGQEIELSGRGNRSVRGQHL